jgi:ATP-dependent Lon protease
MANPESENKKTSVLPLDIDLSYPVLPLRETIIFPGSVAPILLGRESTLRAVEFAQRSNGFLFLVLQKSAAKEEITSDDIYQVGVCARIQSMVILPNNLSKILVEAFMVATIKEFVANEHHLMVKLEPKQVDIPSKRVASHLVETSIRYFRDFVFSAPDVPGDVLETLKNWEHPLSVYFSMLSFLQCEISHKQAILEADKLEQVAGMTETLLLTHKEVGQVQRRIDQEVRQKIQQNQREYLLTEQLKLIQEELGDAPENHNPESKELKEKVIAKKLPEDLTEKLLEEVRRLGMLHQSSPEYSVVRNYIDWFLALPFNVYTKDHLNLLKVKKALNGRHYGLDKIKERILEHVAVLNLDKHNKQTNILCLVGPPGVGKTTLGRSIADALGRNFFRITLGGVRDESEIRGHRRTYIGAMPGRIIQGLKRSKSMNPLILLDEIDKMANDFRGDPAAALLEVLDPEQNHEFSDHYLESGIDLSKVFFVTTANVEEAIPAPLRDRMEVIRISGYHAHEKIRIATEYLFPRICERNGLEANKDLKITQEMIEKIIREYTREAGVRDLERELDKICRKRAMDKVSGRKFEAQINENSLYKYLGVPRFPQSILRDQKRHGVITGLAWTSVGGEILQIECTLLSGRGKMTLTGTLGDVMKESAQIALTLVRERAARFGVDPKLFRQTDIHIHLPEGAIPKDGPSAGIALTLALMSAFTCQKVDRHFAFTGEVSLTGELHAIGGLPEKAIAALDAGVKEIMLPVENDKNVRELPALVKKGLKISQYSHIDEIINKLFKKPKKSP